MSAGWVSAGWVSAGWMSAALHPRLHGAQRPGAAVRSPARRLAIAVACVAAFAVGGAHAQSEASVAVSMLPLASVVGTASVAAAGAAALSAAPVLLSAAGAVFVVKAVEVSARGTVYVLERASDGARVSVEVTARSASAVAVGVGAMVTVSVVGAGLILSTAGEVLAFIPNALGRALLYNERLTP